MFVFHIKFGQYFVYWQNFTLEGQILNTEEKRDPLKEIIWGLTNL